MGYLNRLPERTYPTSDNHGTQTVRDITFATNLLQRKLKNEYFTTYSLSDGERPEIAAFNLYEDPQHYWILLLVNRVVDPFFDWYLSDEQVKQLTLDRYGSLEEVHHYETEEGAWVAEDELSEYANTFAVRNIDYETNENDKKRKILAIKPKYIQKVISQLEMLIDSGGNTNE